MKKLFLMLVCVAMSVLAMGQDNQLVWANGRLLYGTPVMEMDSLTYDEMEDVDTLHLLLPRTLVKVVHDTVYIHDTVYVETDCGGDADDEDDEDDASASIGVFSVGEGKTVSFSPGNLQYHPVNDEWRFAPSQLDYIGEANAYISPTYNGWIDLFGWGTGDNPTNISDDCMDYPTFVDWGVNPIEEYAPNTWRTLSVEEWQHIEYWRENADSLIGIAQVNGVNGMIILPDNWECPNGIKFKSQGLGIGKQGDFAAHQSFTKEQWHQMEELGAVFVPANGWHTAGVMRFVQEGGGFWLSYNRIGNNGCQIVGNVDFYSTHIVSMAAAAAGWANSVRLVKDIEGGGATPGTPTTPEEPKNMENGHEYVDLGLSVKWATCNVGANSPEEYGDYFAWGEVEPKEVYDWSTYKWCNGSYNSLTKYNTSSGYGSVVDNKTVLEAADDAATANWGGAWRMPTDAEMTEILEQCTWTWTTENGVGGYKVTSNKEGYTDKSIFLPAAGYRVDSSLDAAGSGYYWLSSLGTVCPELAHDLYFTSSDVDSYNDYNRCYGRSIRPVCP